MLVYQRVNSCWHLARSGSDSSLCFDTSDLGGESTRRGQNRGFTPFQRTSCRANVFSYSMFLSLKIHICSYIQYVHIYIYKWVCISSLPLSLASGWFSWEQIWKSPMCQVSKRRTNEPILWVDHMLEAEYFKWMRYIYIFQHVSTIFNSSVDTPSFNVLGSIQ